MSFGFALSKILWGLLSPAPAMALALIGAWWWHRRRPALSRVLVAFPMLLLVALGNLPLVHWCAAPLEQRFRSLPEPASVDGIVILGGALDLENTSDLRQPALNSAAERMTAAVVLSRRYPQAKLLFSGGSGLLREQRYNESQVAQALFESLGVDPARFVYEDRSRNTWENAVYSARLAKPQPGETWLLVTSATHMPRAVGCFRKAGWTVVPYPVDYISNDNHFFGLNTAEQLANFTAVAREWVGLLAYHLMGRTDALFPAPQPVH